MHRVQPEIQTFHSPNRGVRVTSDRDSTAPVDEEVWITIHDTPTRQVSRSTSNSFANLGLPGEEKRKWTHTHTGPSATLSRRAGEGDWNSFPESNARGSRRQNKPPVRQQFLKRRPERHGQRSFLPSFSSSCLSPCTMRTPRLTRDSDGNPLRRLRVISKAGKFVEVLGLHGTPPHRLNELS